MTAPFQNDVQSSDFLFESVSLFSSRMQSEVELNNFVSAIEIFEHIEKPYLTGTVALTDTSRIYDRADFQGAEYLEIKIKRSAESPAYSKLFNIDEVISTRKTNDQSIQDVESSIKNNFNLFSYVLLVTVSNTLLAKSKLYRLY